MFDILFYKDRRGEKPVEKYIRELAARTDKDSRVKLNKILDYIRYLREAGLRAKEPYIKRLDGEIWELRPLRDRILFAAWDGKSFILLHVFMKDTRKTPKSEIGQAKRELAEYRERGGSDE